MKENIQPKIITDILDNAECYIEKMRQQEDGREILKELLCFVWGYFDHVEIIEKLAYFSVDKIYRIAAVSLGGRDSYLNVENCRNCRILEEIIATSACEVL